MTCCAGSVPPRSHSSTSAAAFGTTQACTLDVACATPARRVCHPRSGEASCRCFAASRHSDGAATCRHAAAWCPPRARAGVRLLRRSDGPICSAPTTRVCTLCCAHADWGSHRPSKALCAITWGGRPPTLKGGPACRAPSACGSPSIGQTAAVAQLVTQCEPARLRRPPRRRRPTLPYYPIYEYVNAMSDMCSRRLHESIPNYPSFFHICWPFSLQLYHGTVYHGNRQLHTNTRGPWARSCAEASHCDSSGSCSHVRRPRALLRTV